MASKEYYQKNKEYIKEKSREYRKNNLEVRKQKESEYRKKRWKNDELYRLKYKIKTSIKNSFNRNKFTINSNIENIIGCSYSDFILYIESKFKPWMNWSNHGMYTGYIFDTWQLDHIIPVSSAKSEDDLISLNHYTNLQPLDSFINVKKSNNINSIPLEIIEKIKLLK